MTDPLRAAFRKPFAQQVAAWRLRLGNLVPTAKWDDIRHAQHDRAFMVAGATKADLLADLAAAVDRAVAEGTGFEAFKKDFRGIVEKHGWHGWTGDTTDKARNWRMRTIYRTNMRTTYMAGRHAQLVEGAYEYWVYRHGGSQEPRIRHLGWDGLILPPDDPFWATHYPPNDWGCSCRVFGARSIEGARRRGGDPSVELGEGWDKADPKSGMPAGIGKGWDYAPGASVAADVSAMADKTVKWEHVLAKEFMASLPVAVVDDFATGYRSLPSFQDSARRYVDAIQRARDNQVQPAVEPFLTLGRLTSRQVNEVARLGIDAAGYDFNFEASGIAHILKEHSDLTRERLRGQRPVTPLDLALLPQLLDQPFTIEPGVPTRNPNTRAVMFHIDRPGERWNAVFEVRRGRRMLALKTLYIFARN